MPILNHTTTISVVPRRLRALGALNRERRHLEHHRLRLPEPVAVKGVAPAVAAPIIVTLQNPRAVTDSKKTLKSWGIPTSHQDLDLFAHHHDGGWGVFQLPPMIETYSWVAKAAKHRDSAFFLITLAKVALWSNLTLSAALAVIADLARMDRLLFDHPQNWVNEWSTVYISAVDAWQARTSSGAGLGDEAAIAQHIHDFRYMRDKAFLGAAERELERRRAQIIRHANREGHSNA